ncbi:MAG TPA: 4Fe-4S binding protein [Acidobacteriota bacterium]|nr:4Fe-4S binding protein [Acidobacteriota bacterium]
MFRKHAPAALPPRPQAGLWVIREVESSCGSRIFEGGDLGSSGPQALAAAQGAAMSGRRTAAMLPCGAAQGLESALPALRQAARRQVPLVVHALDERDHTAYHLAAESGCVLLMPEDAQHAVDLTLVAHQLSEQSLIPVVLVHDWLAQDGVEEDPPQEWTASLELPSQRLMRRYLGREDDSLESPSEAQFQVFGEYRRRVPRWMDPDHPVAWPDRPAQPEVGREVFFRQQVAESALKAIDVLARETGRPLAPLRTYEIDNADQVIVTQGAIFHPACRLAQRLRQQQGWKVGVLGLTWLRPLSSFKLRDALSAGPRLTVLERVPQLYRSHAPLRRELCTALGKWDDSWITAHLPDHGAILLAAQRERNIAETEVHGKGREHLIESQLASLLGEQRNRPGRRTSVVLGLPASPGESPFPKRESLLAAVRNAYPQLKSLSADSSTDGHRLAAAPGESPAGREPEIPPLVRRMGPGEHGFRSLATFWGDVAQPLREGAYEGFPDPLFTLGSVPSSSAALAPPVEADILPLLDADRCSGCGHCWTICPDSAISATVIGLRPWLDHAIQPLAKHPQGSSLRRVMGKWVAQIASRLGEGQVLDADLVVKAYQDVAPVPAGQSTGPAAQRGPAAASGEVAGGNAEASGKLSGGGAEAARPNSEQHTDRDTGTPGEDASGLLGDLRATLEEATASPAILTERFFEEAESRKSSDGALLFLGFNPSTCRACRACIEECPEDALSSAGRGGEIVRQTARAWNSLEGFPDTPGKIIADALRQAESVETATAASSLGRSGKENGSPGQNSASQHGFSSQTESYGAGSALENPPQDGDEQEAASPSQRPYPGWTRLASMLLSRHCAQAQLGGGSSEPGSGARLAGRLVAAVAEYAGQQQSSRRIGRLQELSGQVHDRLHKLLSAGLDEADPELLESALGELGESETRLGRLDEALAKRGKSIRLDRDKIADLAHLERLLQDASWRLEEGPSRLGRTRFQVVAAGPSAARWAACYPWHPFHAPLVADLSERGIDLTLGLAESSAGEAVEEARLLRSAQLKAQDPPDLKDQLRQLDHLTWKDLDGDERAACAPVLLLTDPETLASHSLAALGRLMSADYPIKVVLLNRHKSDFGTLAGENQGLCSGDDRPANPQSASRQGSNQDGPEMGGDPGPLKSSEPGGTEPRQSSDSKEEGSATSQPGQHPDQGSSRYSDRSRTAQTSAASQLPPASAQASLDATDRKQAPARAVCGGTSPTALSQAIFFPRAFLLSSTPAHPAHLCQGLEAAFDYSGPALIDLYAPSPFRDGFSPADYLLRARGAVEARVHPLVRRDPRSEGVLGTQISLEGNPVSGQEWGALTFSDWARGEVRLNSLEGDQLESLAKSVQQRWKTLQEVAGVSSPFVERIRQQLEKENQEELNRSQESLQSQYEERRAQDQRSFQDQVAQALRRRLRQLAGIDSG